MLFSLKTYKKLCKHLIRHYGFDLVFRCKDRTARWRDGLEHDTCRQGEWTYTITCFSPSPLPFHFMSALPSPDFHKLFTLHVCICIMSFSSKSFTASCLHFHPVFFSKSFAVSCLHCHHVFSIKTTTV